MAERVKHGNGRLHALRPVPLRSPAVLSARRRFSWLWSRESLLRLALSLVLATALWLYVTGLENPTYVDFSQPIPVSSTEPALGLIITSPPASVHVRYHPDNPNVFPTSSTFTASINVTKLGPGRHTVPITVSAEPGFAVVGVSPSRVAVVIEALATKRVNVVVRYLSSGRTPEAGYYALPAETNPNVVTVSGPQSLVRQIKDVAVTESLTGAAATILTSAKPLPENSQGNLLPSTTNLTIDPSPVSVTIPIRAIGGIKTLPLVVSVNGSPRAGFGVVGVSVDPSSVTAFGSPTTLNRLTTVSASVNVSGRRGGTFRSRVPIHTSVGVRLSPRRATVVIRLAPIAASTSTDVAVRPLGVSAGLVAHIRPGAVLVTFVGPSSGLATATKGLDATVNVAGLGTGVYQLQPQISVPRGFTIHAFDPQTVSVVVAVAPTR